MSRRVRRGRGGGGEKRVANSTRRDLYTAPPWHPAAPRGARREDQASSTAIAALDLVSELEHLTCAAPRPVFTALRNAGHRDVSRAWPGGADSQVHSQSRCQSQTPGEPCLDASQGCAPPNSNVLTPYELRQARLTTTPDVGSSDLGPCHARTALGGVIGGLDKSGASRGSCQTWRWRAGLVRAMPQ